MKLVLVTSHALRQCIYNIFIVQIFLGIFTQSICQKINYLHREITPIKTDNEKTVSYGKTVPDKCTKEFTTDVDICMWPFVQRLTTLHQLRLGVPNTQRLLHNWTRQQYCIKYEEMLMCLHRTLQKCDTEETTRVIQDKLNVPWVMKTNKICHINVKTNSANPGDKQSDQTAREEDFQTDTKDNKVLSTDNNSENSQTNDRHIKTGLHSETLRFQRTLFYKMFRLKNQGNNPTEMGAGLVDTDASNKYAQSKDTKVFSAKISKWRTRIGKLLFEVEI